MPNRTIVVADDNRDAADSLCSLLQTMGYEADATYDGRQALEACQVTHPALAILDVEMPVLDGCAAAARLRQIPDPPTCIASLSGARLDLEPWVSRCAVFDVHLRKPVDIDEISSLLKQVSKPAS